MQTGSGMCPVPELTGLHALPAAPQKLACCVAGSSTRTCKGAAEAFLLYPCKYWPRTSMMHCSLQAGLQELAFQNVGCSIRACEAVAELVTRPQELRRLHLHNNMSDDAGAVAIAQARPTPVALLPHTSPGLETVTGARTRSSAPSWQLWCKAGVTVASVLEARAYPKACVHHESAAVNLRQH